MREVSQTGEDSICVWCDVTDNVSRAANIYVMDLVKYIITR